jgi:hypothetical protein
MPRVRSLRSLGRRFTAINSLLLLVALGTGGTLFFRAATRDTTFVLLLVAFALSVAGCILLDRIMIRRIACPSCGKTLDKAKPPRGKIISVQYECPDCDTLWDTDAPPDEDGKVRYADPLE